LTSPPRLSGPITRNPSSGCSRFSTSRMRDSQSSIPLVIVLRHNLLGGDLAPSIESGLRRTRGSQALRDGALRDLQLGESQKEAPDIGKVRWSLCRPGTGDHALHLPSDQVSRRDNQDVLDNLVSRKTCHPTNVNQVSIPWLSNLVQTMTLTTRHCPYP